MPQLQRKVLVLRGHDTTDDPEAVGYVEALVEIVKAEPKRRPLGEQKVYVGDVIEAPKARFLEIEVETWGFTREGVASTAAVQDWGDLDRLDEVLAMQHVYIYRAYEHGDDPTIPLRRAASHAPTASGVDAWWYARSSTTDGYPWDLARGHLPLAVECLDGLAPQLSSGGVSELSFTLTSRAPLS